MAAVLSDKIIVNNKYKTETSRLKNYEQFDIRLSPPDFFIEIITMLTMIIKTIMQNNKDTNQGYFYSITMIYF